MVPDSMVSDKRGMVTSMDKAEFLLAQGQAT